MKRIIFCLLFASLALMTSCLGASIDIVMRADGSGTVALEYRASQMLESLGRLDGNAGWPAIPVGKADFERSVARIPGLRLSSYSVSGDKDLITKVKLDFKEPAALLAFLDSSGSRATIARKGGKNVLRLVLLDPVKDAIDTDLLSLLQEISSGYEISISFTSPKDATLSCYSWSCFPPTFPVIVPQGKKVSFAVGTGELVGMRDGLTLEIVW